MLTWDEVRKLAESLEFQFEDDTHSDDADGIFISKFGGSEGWFQDSEAGRLAAREWLEGERATWDATQQWIRERR